LKLKKVLSAIKNLKQTKAQFIIVLFTVN